MLYDMCYDILSQLYLSILFICFSYVFKQFCYISYMNDIRSTMRNVFWRSHKWENAQPFGIVRRAQENCRAFMVLMLEEQC